MWGTSSDIVRHSSLTYMDVHWVENKTGSAFTEQIRMMINYVHELEDGILKMSVFPLINI